MLQSISAHLSDGCALLIPCSRKSARDDSRIGDLVGLDMLRMDGIRVEDLGRRRWVFKVDRHNTWASASRAS